MKYRFKVLFTILFSGTIGFTFAQENTLTSGAETTGDGGSVSYSIGQVRYETFNGSNESLIEGIQQPYEISTLTSIEGTNGVELLVTAYPNPTVDYLTLNVENMNLTSLSYQLYDINGKIVFDGTIKGTDSNIIMSNLPPSTYFLKVQNENNNIKTFKINKL